MKSPTASMPGKLAVWLRPHWLFLIVAPIALVAMTTPTLHLALDTGAYRLHTGPTDIFMKYWDAWYGGEMLAGRADFYHTDLLFFPNELSLAFHNFSLPHIFVFGSLQRVMPAFNAYLLSYLLIIAANLAASYMFLLRLVSRPAIACAGAFVVGFSTFVMKHQEHPDMALVATIPLALFCLHRAVHEGQWRWCVFAGIVAGFTAFIGMYVFVCLMMTLGIYALFLARTRWRDARFWQFVVALLLVAGAISMLRLYPMIADRALLSEVLDKKSGSERHNDLLMLFVNTDHPLMLGVKAQLFEGGRLWAYADGYLGYLPLAVIGWCLLRSRRRRQLLPWLALASLFIVLRLGSFLTIGGTQFFPLPKYALDRLLPWVFEAFWNIANFQIGLLLPWATLFALSLDWLLDSLSARKRLAAVAAVLLIICAENYSETSWMISRDPQRLDWIDWLEGEGSADDLRLIHLPMGRNHSKEYGYFQTFNRIPHVEGLASRTPLQAYATIDSNLLLRAWQADASLQCKPENRAAYLRAVDELRALGFTHIVHHRQQLDALQVFAGFVDVPSAFDDRFVTIFLVDDLPYACDRPEFLAAASQAQKRLLADYPSLRSAHGITTITIHRESLVTMAALHSQMRIDLERASRRAHARKLLADQVAVLLRSSGQSPDDLPQAYRDWLMDDFRLCDTLGDEGELRMEVLLRRGVPCALVMDETPLAVDYENGLRLSNLALEVNEDALDLHILWRSFPEELHSFSLQLLDAAGERMLGYDQIIRDDTLTHHRIDASSLAPGDYRAKLIVYNYETRASVPGVIVDTDTPFQREVDVDLISID